MCVAFNGDHVLKGGCKEVHFLHHNECFCKVLCIYMLLTCHKINNMPNVLQNFKFQLE